MGIDRKAQHPAAFGKRPQHAVGLVAQCRMPACGIGMGDRDGPCRVFDRLKGRSFARMAHVHDHADPVHLRHHRAAHAGQAGVVILIAARGQQRLVVVAQLHEAQAKRVQDLHEADVILDAGRVLRAEEDRGAAGVAGALHIRRRPPLEDKVGEPFEPAVPAFDLQDRLTEGLVIGDGDMDRVNPARAHLAKDPFRPVGILQPVDQGRHSGAPAAT